MGLDAFGDSDDHAEPHGVQEGGTAQIENKVTVTLGEAPDHCGLHEGSEDNVDLFVGCDDRPAVRQVAID
jgi:hypothetical protein